MHPFFTPLKTSENSEGEGALRTDELNLQLKVSLHYLVTFIEKLMVAQWTDLFLHYFNLVLLIYTP